MIIQIRGVSGSGKSTVVNKIMATTEKWEPVNSNWDGKKRKNPLYYVRKSPGTSDKAILGHYETLTTCGCDTLGNSSHAFKLTQQVIALLKEPYCIICEGLLLSEDVKWTSQLPDVHIIFLNTSIKTCLDRIRTRRLARGKTKEGNTYRTTTRYHTVMRARLRLLEAGVTCLRASSDQAHKIVLKWMKELDNNAR